MNKLVFKIKILLVWKNKFENTIHNNNFCGSSRFGDQINMYYEFNIQISPIMKIFDHTNNELNIQV